MASESENENSMVSYPTLRVTGVFLDRCVNSYGERTIYFIVQRKGKGNIRSFTINYSFSPEDYDKLIPGENLFQYVCEEEPDKTIHLIRLSVPAIFAVTRCSAYIASIETSDGTVKFDPVPAIIGDGNLPNMMIDTATVDVRITRDGTTMKYDPKKADKKGISAAKLLLACEILLIVLALVAVGAAVSSIVSSKMGSAELGDTMEVVRTLNEGGLRSEAQSYADSRLGDDEDYIEYRDRIDALADKLIQEGRYNEAYAIVSETPFASALQKICESASASALEAGDYENAYAYAFGAPNDFTEEVVSRALDNAFDAETMTLNESAYRVAVGKCIDSARTDELLRRVIKAEAGRGSYVSALNTARMLKNDSENLAFDILKEAVEKACASGNYFEAADYLGEYKSIEGCDELVESTGKPLYNKAIEAGDYATAARYAKRFNYNISDSIKVKAEDSGVRAALSSVYFLLTGAQKRTYHSNSIAVSNQLYFPDINGRYTVQFHGTTTIKSNISSIAAGKFITAFLHKDGTVELLSHLSAMSQNTYTADKDIINGMKIPSEGVVDVAVGERHLVCLMENGSVICSGDNSFEQCGTSSWTNIVAVAAGANFTVGLRADGTVVACGSNKCGQCSLDGYANVCDVRACNQSTVLLFTDGSVAVVGDRGEGLDAASGWNKVRRIRAGGNIIMAETTEGKYLICGNPEIKLGNLSSVDDFDCGDFCVAYLTSGGKKHFVKGSAVPESWN